MIIKGVHQRGMGGANRSIKKQKAVFIRRGLPLETCFNGTININSLPNRYSLIKFDALFRNVIYWSIPRFRREDFGFINIISLRHKGKEYKNWGYIYFAHKSPHSNSDHVFELLGPELKDLTTGDELVIEIGDGLLECTDGRSRAGQ